MKSPKVYLFLLLFLATSPAKSENADQGGYPIYNHKDGTLTIPRVDTSDQVGRYQNVMFQFDPQPNVWILETFQSRESNGTKPHLRIAVPAVWSSRPTIPDQAELHVVGEFTCGRIGQINQRHTNNLFEIQITLDPLQPDEVCDHETRTFSRTIQLDVARLKAGEYQFSINNILINRTFTLPVDTIVADECGGNPEHDDSNCSVMFTGEVVELRNDDRGGYPVYNAKDGTLTRSRVWTRPSKSADIRMLFYALIHSTMHGHWKQQS